MATKRIIDLPTDNNPAASDYIPIDGATTRATQISNLSKAMPAFTGDSGAGGAKGLVPSPAPGDATKFLAGDGTWKGVSGGALGQCQLVKVGANLVLQYFNGNQITINGANQTISSSGVSLAPTGLTPSTLYYIYAFMNTGTLTLEASTTAPAVSTGSGVKIKAGDATRTLVGMAYVIAGPAFADTAGQRLVASYFNRLARPLLATLGTTGTISATSFTNVTGLSLEFLDWGDEPITAAVNGSWAVTGAATGFARVLFDVSTSGAARSATSNTTTNGLSLLEPASMLAIGYHTLTVQAYRSAGTNVQLFGTSTGADFATTLAATVRI